MVTDSGNVGIYQNAPTNILTPSAELGNDLIADARTTCSSRRCKRTSTSSAGRSG